MTSVREQIREFVLSNFYVGETALNDDTPLLDGIIDSTGVVEVIGFLEATFEIALDDSELTPENFASIDAIARYVNQKLHPIAEEERDAAC